MERDWIDQAKKGDKIALNRLISDNYNLLAGYVTKMTGNREMAQDVVQDTLLKAIENLETYQPVAKFSTWLIKIASNRMRDLWRKNRPMELLEDTLPSWEEEPDQVTLRKIEYLEALEILQVLPPEKRMVFILKNYYGYKYEEIASMVHCPVGTVRSRLHFCVKKIMEEVERRERCGDEERRKGKASH